MRSCEYSSFFIFFLLFSLVVYAWSFLFSCGNMFSKLFSKVDRFAPLHLLHFSENMSTFSSVRGGWIRAESSVFHFRTVACSLILVILESLEYCRIIPEWLVRSQHSFLAPVIVKCVLSYPRMNYKNYCHQWHSSYIVSKYSDECEERLSYYYYCNNNNQLPKFSAFQSLGSQVTRPSKAYFF